MSKCFTKMSHQNFSSKYLIKTSHQNVPSKCLIKKSHKKCKGKGKGKGKSYFKSMHTNTICEGCFIKESTTKHTLDCKCLI